MAKQLKEVRAANTKPVNFTCGGCKKVQPYSTVTKYECPDCGYGKDIFKEE